MIMIYIVLEPEIYNKLPEPEDDENDILGATFGSTDMTGVSSKVDEGTRWLGGCVTACDEESVC